MTAADERGRKPACPICGRPATTGAAPFCSPRCADVDLQRWLSDRYVIPVPDDEAENDPEAANVAGQRGEPGL